MKGCYNCAHGAWLNGEDDLHEICVECNYVPGYPSNWKSKAVTNADHFREQISTDDGLAKFLMKVHDDGIYIPFCQNKE
jgi:hypothetical protein